ncbi:hypothetical protein ACO34A_05915 [Rhizobium sp. ACO-34A]|nr:hypothetical protein ACO34A_05915 [Rhizobium sp. ACO-34A]
MQSVLWPDLRCGYRFAARWVFSAEHSLHTGLDHENLRTVSKAVARAFPAQPPFMHAALRGPFPG